MITSEKAFNTIQEDKVKNPQNVIHFLTQSMSSLYEENKKYLKNLNEILVKKDYIIVSNLEINLIWSCLLEMISNYTKWLTNFAKKCPGFHVFDDEDLSTQIASAVFFLYGFCFRKLVFNNNHIFVSKSNLFVSRQQMILLFGENLTDLLFLCYKILNELELTECEVSIFHPVILLSCDANLVKDKEYMIDLRTYYVKALLNQFRINNRDNNFSRKLNTVSFL